MRLLAPLILVLVALFQQPQPHQLDIDPDDLPDIQSPAEGVRTETITVSVAAAPRAKDEAELRELLLQDVRNASVNRAIVDAKLRARIRSLCAKIPSED